MAGASGLGLSANLTSILAWTILPSFLADTLLTLYYRLSPSSRPTVPPRATPSGFARVHERSQAHHRRARILLIAAYLAYSVVSVYLAQSRGFERNYYALLGISRALVEADGAPAVKSQWRRLARVYHPDKVGKSGEAFFVLLRRGVEVLEHDGRRWAYERFGPTVTDWGKLVTPREFLAKGALNSILWWAFAAAALSLFSFFRKNQRHYKFWRYLALCLCVSLELHLIVRPTPSPSFSFAFPSRLPFEHVALLRQIFISTSMAISQLAPLLSPHPPRSSARTADKTGQEAHVAALKDAERLHPLLQRLAAVSSTTEREVAALQRLELVPLLPDGADAALEDGRRTGTRSEAEQRVRSTVEKQMVQVWQDLQLKGSNVTARVWTEAVREGRAREARDRTRQAGAPTLLRARQESSGVPEPAEGAGSTAQELEQPELPTLDTAIPSPVTVLASPPASPRLGLPLSSLKPVASDVIIDQAPAAQDGRGGVKDGAALPLPPVNAAHRLPTPPPEDSSKP